MERLLEYEWVEDSNCLYSSLSLIDNMVELYGEEASEKFCLSTNLLPLLFKKLDQYNEYIDNKKNKEKGKKDNEIIEEEEKKQETPESNINQNISYISELLSILLLSSKKIKDNVDNILKNLNVIEILLIMISNYRKNSDNLSLEEQELIENLFLILNFLLQNNIKYKKDFINSQGYELFFKILNTKYSFLIKNIFSSIYYSLILSPINSIQFIIKGGLKILGNYSNDKNQDNYLPSSLIKYKKELNTNKKLSLKSIKQRDEKYSKIDKYIYLIWNELIYTSYLFKNSKIELLSDLYPRIINKLIDKNSNNNNIDKDSKFSYFLNLFLYYINQLKYTEKEILLLQDNNEELNDDLIYLMRYDGGLNSLQHLSIFIIHYLIMFPSSFQPFLLYLEQNDLKFSDILNFYQDVIEEYSINEEKKIEDDESLIENYEEYIEVISLENNELKFKKSLNYLYRNMLISWLSYLDIEEVVEEEA